MDGLWTAVLLPESVVCFVAMIQHAVVHANIYGLMSWPEILKQFAGFVPIFMRQIWLR